MANATIEQQISDLLDNYIASFNARDYSQAASYYSDPSTAISALSVNVMGDQDDRIAMIKSIATRLRQNGVDHSAWAGPKKIIVLDEKGLVLASCPCKRLRNDGSSFEEFTATYSLSKLNGQDWKIASVHQHPFETQLR